MKGLFLFFFTVTLTIGSGSATYAIPAQYSSDHFVVPSERLGPIPGDLMNARKFRLDDSIQVETEMVETTASEKNTNEIKLDRGQVFGRLPMHFEPNLGQLSEEVKFTARGHGYTLFLTDTEAVFTLQSPRKPSDITGKHKLVSTIEKQVNWEPSQVLRMQPGGDALNKNPKITGQEKHAGVSNYILGEDKNKWQTGVPHYSKVQYEDIYPGIDLVYYGNPQQLEYDFVVEPGADPNQIQLAFEGADNIQIAENGNLNIKKADLEFMLRAPVIYQVRAGKRETINGHFVIQENKFRRTSEKNIQNATQIGFQLATYDTSLPLIIDPVVEYSTYLGDSEFQEALAITVDPNGNATVTGFTFSTDFPDNNAAYPNYAGSGDAFVTQFDSSGQVVYSTYLGGNEFDWGQGIAADSNGNVFVTGRTESSNFPNINAAYPNYAGSGDVFVTQFNSSGQVVYSTFLGGSDFEEGHGITVDNSGNVFVTGSTRSTDFPNDNATYPSNAGSADAFVTQFNSNGQVIYSTYLGGTGFDRGYGIAVDDSGDVLLGGQTSSTDFPIGDAVYPANAGGDDAFVTRFNSVGEVVYSTYLGGSNFDNVHGISVDASGNAFVTGVTDSSNFPVENAAYPDNSGGYDAFVTQLNSIGQVVYSTYLGGAEDDWGFGVDVSSIGNAVISGNTDSPNFPNNNAAYPDYLGGRDAFVTQFNSNGQVLYSTYLGGSSSEWSSGIALDVSGNAYVTGQTYSADFPVENAVYPNYLGDGDVFVTKLTALDNQVPVAESQEITTEEETPVEITLTGTDPDGDSLDYTVLTQPKNGVLSGAAPFLIYTPDDDFEGADIFTFQVSDGSAISTAATVTIMVEDDDKDCHRKHHRHGHLWHRHHWKGNHGKGHHGHKNHRQHGRKRYSCDSDYHHNDRKKKRFSKHLN